MTFESFVLTSVSLVAAIISLLSLRSNNKRTDAEAEERRASAEKSKAESKSLEDAITDRVMARANTEIEKLTERVALLEAEIEEYKIGVGLLMGQLINARIEPTWKPKGITITQKQPGGRLLK